MQQKQKRRGRKVASHQCWDCLPWNCLLWNCLPWNCLPSNCHPPNCHPPNCLPPKFFGKEGTLAFCTLARDPVFTASVCYWDSISDSVCTASVMLCVQHQWSCVYIISDTVYSISDTVSTASVMLCVPHQWSCVYSISNPVCTASVCYWDAKGAKC